MNRDYADGTSDTVTFFTGTEIEKTPAFGLKTLFVTGLQHIDVVYDNYKKFECEHIFFGANHSYNPSGHGPNEFKAWDTLIQWFLDKGILCSLDIPSNINLEWVLEGGLAESNNFIPQIRVVIPYVAQWNYNTMVKIDDRGFNETNPGVWCHSLHSLMDRDKFTNWAQYGLDNIIK